MPSPELVLVVRRPVRWRRVGTEAVVVLQDAGQVAGLNGTAAAVLGSIDGRTTVEGVVDLLAPRWAVSRERLAEDVGRILDQLLEMRVLEVVQAGEGTPESERPA